MKFKIFLVSTFYSVFAAGSEEASSEEPARLNCLQSIAAHDTVQAVLNKIKESDRRPKVAEKFLERAKKQFLTKTAYAMCKMEYDEPLDCEKINDKATRIKKTCRAVNGIATDVFDKCSRWVERNEDKCTEWIDNSDERKQKMKDRREKRKQRKNKDEDEDGAMKPRSSAGVSSDDEPSDDPLAQLGKTNPLED